MIQIKLDTESTSLNEVMTFISLYPHLQVDEMRCDIWIKMEKIFKEWDKHFPNIPNRQQFKDKWDQAINLAKEFKPYRYTEAWKFTKIAPNTYQCGA